MEGSRREREGGRERVISVMALYESSSLPICFPGIVLGSKERVANFLQTCCSQLLDLISESVVQGETEDCKRGDRRRRER